MKMYTVAGLDLLLCTSLTFAQRGIGPIVNSVPSANPREVVVLLRGQRHAANLSLRLGDADVQLVHRPHHRVIGIAIDSARTGGDRLAEAIASRWQRLRP